MHVLLTFFLQPPSIFVWRGKKGCKAKLLWNFGSQYRTQNGNQIVENCTGTGGKVSVLE